MNMDRHAEVRTRKSIQVATTGGGGRTDLNGELLDEEEGQQEGVGRKQTPKKNKPRKKRVTVRRGVRSSALMRRVFMLLVFLLIGIIIIALNSNMMRKWFFRKIKPEDPIRSYFERGGTINHENKVLSTYDPAIAEHSLHNKHTNVYNESFSVCLLMSDDNQRLPEWLAYHYFAMVSY